MYLYEAHPIPCDWICAYIKRVGVLRIKRNLHVTKSRKAHTPCVTPTYGFEARVKLDGDLKTFGEAYPSVDLLLV